MRMETANRPGYNLNIAVNIFSGEENVEAVFFSNIDTFGDFRHIGVGLEKSETIVGRYSR